MGAKRQAKKQFEKELELEKLRNKSAAAQQRKEIQQAKFDAMTPEELAKFRKKRLKIFAIVGGVFVALMVIGSVGGNDSGTSSSGKTTVKQFPATIEAINVINPATVNVTFNVKNDGNTDISPSCTINVKDASNTYHGYDIFVIKEPMSPGQQRNGVGPITVTKQGAAFVTESSISCTAETSDTTSNAGKAVKIISINPNKAPLSDFDSDTNSWYWGVSLRADAKPWTRLTCTQTAFDVSGKEIAKHTYPANVVNDGTVIAYGNNVTSMPDTTKAIAKAIKDVKVSCHL